MPDVRLSNVEYTSDRHATVTLRGCTDDYACRVAVLVTDNNWQSEQVVVAVPKPRDFPEVWTKAIPDGAVAVIPPGAGEGSAIPPFVLRSDGEISRLSVSREPRAPGPDSLLVSGSSSRAGGQVWALDPSTAEVYPTRSQPCDCGRPFVDVVDLATDVDGSAFALVEDANVDVDTMDERLALISSRDNGVSWETSNDLMPDNFAPYATGDQHLAAGPGGSLAAVWATDPGVDSARVRLFVSDDEQTWRRVSTGSMSKYYSPDMGFRLDGTLWVAQYDDPVYTLPPGGDTLAPSTGTPARAFGLVTAGDTLAVTTGRRTIAVSLDGLHWTTVRPGSTLDTGKGKQSGGGGSPPADGDLPASGT
jgi:hypothetical protein